MKTQTEKLNKLSLSHWSDYTGIFASALCLIHCWTLPLIILVLPGVMAHDELVHPVLGGAAILSTVPLFLKKSFRDLPKSVHIALLSGIVMLLAMLLSHEHLNITSEVLLSSAGGFMLAFVHFRHLSKRKSHSH